MAGSADADLEEWPRYEPRMRKQNWRLVSKRRDKIERVAKALLERDKVVTASTSGLVFFNNVDILTPNTGPFTTHLLDFNGLSIGSALVPAAVPLPAALPLFLSGLAVFGFVVRRRRSAAAA